MLKVESGNLMKFIPVLVLVAYLVGCSGSGGGGASSSEDINAAVEPNNQEVDITENEDIPKIDEIVLEGLPENGIAVESNGIESSNHKFSIYKIVGGVKTPITKEESFYLELLSSDESVAELIYNPDDGTVNVYLHGYGYTELTAGLHGVRKSFDFISNDVPVGITLDDSRFYNFGIIDVFCKLERSGSRGRYRGGIIRVPILVEMESGNTRPLLQKDFGGYTQVVSYDSERRFRDLIYRGDYYIDERSSEIVIPLVYTDDYLSENGLVTGVIDFTVRIAPGSYDKRVEFNLRLKFHDI